jgi:hypothetical protein
VAFFVEVDPSFMAKDPGQTLRTARLFPISATNRTFRERLSAKDQVDIWKISPKTRSSLNLTLGGIAKQSNADVELLNAGGRVIASAKQRGNRTEKLSNVLLEAGTFYVRVKLQRNRAETRYALTLSATPTADQLGNSFETATPLRAATGTYDDFVGSTDPNDFLGFGTLIAGQFNVSLTGLSDDANLELYDGSQNLLFASQNTGTAPENINQRLTGIAGSSYFLRVTPALGKNASYSLNYSFTPETPVRTASGLQYIDINPGTGETPRTGQTVTVQYTGLLTNGVKFDSSRDRNQPFSFTIGVGDVIRGWDEGISTMTVGARRQLIIPAELAYGSRGAGSTIPPNATLIFDVEVLGIS